MGFQKGARIDQGEAAPALRSEQEVDGRARTLVIGEIDPGVVEVVDLVLEQDHRRQAGGPLTAFDHLQDGAIGDRQANDRRDRPALAVDGPDPQLHRVAGDVGLPGGFDLDREGPVRPAKHESLGARNPCGIENGQAQNPFGGRRRFDRRLDLPAGLDLDGRLTDQSLDLGEEDPVLAGRGGRQLEDDRPTRLVNLTGRRENDPFLTSGRQSNGRLDTHRFRDPEGVGLAGDRSEGPLAPALVGRLERGDRPARAVDDDRGHVGRVAPGGGRLDVDPVLEPDHEVAAFRIGGQPDRLQENRDRLGGRFDHAAILDDQ